MAFNSDNWSVTDIDMVVRVRGARTGVTKEFGPRRYHGLILQLEGGCRYVPEGQKPIEHEAGGILYLPEGVPYRVFSYEQSDCIAINFHIREKDSIDAFRFQPRVFSLWKDTFFECLSAWEAHRTGYMTRCRSMLYQLLAMLTEQQTEQSMPILRLEMTRTLGNYLLEHMGDPELTIEEAMGEIQLGETQLRSQFHQVYGMTPRQYLIHIRMSRAKEMLAASEVSISQIAVQCGYETLYNFSRAFRQETGYSPMEYRREFS